MGGSATRICLVGATGLVGSALIAQAVGHDDLRIIGVGRREATIPIGARMEMLVAEPIDWPELIKAARADVLISALGTTIRTAGSRDLFRAIDYDLIRFSAEAARESGVSRMMVVSSIGADVLSRNFYLSVKGETEAALSRSGFKRLDILRPGLLRGERAELRPGERAGQVLAPLIDPFLRSDFRRYRSIYAHEVADAMIALTKHHDEGRFVHEHDAMRRLAGVVRREDVSRRGLGKNAGLPSPALTWPAV